MDCHQRNAVRIGCVATVHIRQKGYFLHEHGERTVGVGYFLLALDEILDAVYKFLHVFIAGYFLRVGGGTHHAHYAGFAQYFFSCGKCVFVLCIYAECLYHRSERVEFGARAGIYAQLRQFVEIFYDLENRTVVMVGGDGQFVESGVAYSTCRIVDDAQKRFLVLRVDGQTHICQYVLDFLA